MSVAAQQMDDRPIPQIAKAAKIFMSYPDSIRQANGDQGLSVSGPKRIDD
jgi:hypothetical protein